jgi:hypothetical protein
MNKKMKKTVTSEIDQSEADYKKDRLERYNKIYSLVRDIDNLAEDGKDLTISHDIRDCYLEIPVVVEISVDYEFTEGASLVFNFECNFSYSENLFALKIHNNSERCKFYDNLNNRLYEFLSDRFDFLTIDRFGNRCYYDKLVMKFWAIVVII